MKNRAFGFRLFAALSGFGQALLSERSLRTQLLAIVGVFAIASWLGLPLLWWAVLIVLCALILAAELINTAIERLCDHLHPERHPNIKAVKDIAAAAVLMLSLAALAVAVLVLLAVG